jgi:hypothetical protein
MPKWRDNMGVPPGRGGIGSKLTFHSQETSRRFRDAAPTAGHGGAVRVGSHSASYKLSHGTDGRLTVEDETGNTICTYERAGYRAEADADGETTHIFKTGPFDLDAHLALEPEQTDDRRRGDYDPDYPGDEPPEDDRSRRQRHHVTHDLPPLASGVVVTGNRDDTPQNMQAGIKALGKRLATHYQGRR